MPVRSTIHKVVVIGSGYAGRLAANRLRKRDDVGITLVNPRPRFIERMRLHQFVAGSGGATADYGSLLGEGIDLVVDSATRIDTAARTVRLASGRDLDYDYVIYAVGSTTAIPPSVPGGDAAAPSGQPVRMSSQAAAPLGAQAADTVLSRIAGTEPAVIDFAFTGSCVSLGRHNGVRQFARKDDTALNMYLGGRAVAACKELTCKLGRFKIRLEARRPGSMPWPKGGTRPEQPVCSARAVASS